MKDLYGESSPSKIMKELNTETGHLYEMLNHQLGTLIDYDDSIIYLNEEITDNSVTDFIIRMRSLLQYRADKQAPVNILIDSPGGDVYATLGIIDYIEQLDMKVNTLCRGKAFSAAAIILACGTGTRMCSKRSTVMLHQTSSFLGGKMSDISAFLENVKMLENIIYDLLAEKTKKDTSFWRDNMKSDMFLTSDQLLSYGLIDQII